MAQLAEQLTLLIPTFNRPRLVRRVLRYYSGCGARIIVADSSDTADMEIPQLFPDVEYQHYDCAEYRSKFLDATRRIDTPYFLMCADDDFVLLSAINACIDFLDTHPHVSAVQGQQSNFHIAPGRIPAVAYSLRYPFQYLDHVTVPADPVTDPLQRLRRVLSTDLYLPWVYGVHRTDVLLLVRELYDQLEDDRTFDWLWAFSVAFHGAPAVLPLLYCVRYQFPHASRSKLIDRMDSEHLIDRRRLNEVYTTLASVLAERHGLNLVACLEAVNAGFEDSRAWMVEKRRKMGYVRVGLAGRRKCSVEHCLEGHCAQFPDDPNHPVMRENHALLGIEESYTCVAPFVRLFPLFENRYAEELADLATRIAAVPE